MAAAAAVAAPRDVEAVSSIEAALGAVAADAAIILTPTATHVELALTALRSGLHVMIEKPVATDRRRAPRTSSPQPTLRVGR